jgi:hypothetical protein
VPGNEHREPDRFVTIGALARALATSYDAKALAAVPTASEARLLRKAAHKDVHRLLNANELLVANDLPACVHALEWIADHPTMSGDELVELATRALAGSFEAP